MRTAASSIELLEARIAPASTLAFVNPNTATYTDVDGDHVTVHFSKPILTAANLTTVLITATAGLGDILDAIKLTSLRAVANHTNITVSVKAVAGDDGLTTVGVVNAFGVDLGTVKIHSDLELISAGSDGGSNVAVKMLNVQSFGLYGFGVESILAGQLGALRVATDFRDGADILVRDDSAGANGRIGSIFIGGALEGGATIATAGGGIGRVHVGKILGDGQITSAGDIGRVVVPGGIAGTGGILPSIESTDGGIASVVIGGTTTGFGTVQAKHDIGRAELTGAFDGVLKSTAGNIGPVAVTGALRGEIDAALNLGAVSIGGDVRGVVISDTGRIASVKIGGSMVDGGIAAISTGPITVLHDIVSNGGGAGTVIRAGTIDALTVGGSVTSTGTGGPLVTASQLMRVNIGHDLAGAKIEAIGGAGRMVSVKIGGSVTGGGILEADNDIGTVKIGHSLTGQSTIESLTGSIGAVRVGGSIAGSSTIEAKTDLLSLRVGGSVASSTVKTDAGKIGSVNIGGLLADDAQIQAQMDFGVASVGGDVESSNILTVSGEMTSLTIGGSIRDGSTVSASGNLGTVAIGGDIDTSTVTSLHGDIGSVKVGGSIVTSGVINAFVNANGNLGSVSVGGDVNNATITSTFGSLGDIKIAGSLVNRGLIQCPGNIDSVTVGGDVDHALIFAQGTAGVPLTIKAVTVHGNWIASSLSAGVKDTNGNGFGNSDDTRVSSASTITSIAIGGAVIGNASGGGGHFGFDAQEITSFKLGGIALPLHPGSSNDVIQLSPITGDVTVREVA